MAHATAEPTYSVTVVPLTATVTECHAAAATGQGLTLVHFTAEPEPFLTQNTPYTTPNIP